MGFNLVFKGLKSITLYTTKVTTILLFYSCILRVINTKKRKIHRWYFKHFQNFCRRF